jgi:hypothetical protein
MTTTATSLLSRRSAIALEGVHPDLVRVVERALELGARFEVTEGLRSLHRQRELIKHGASKTLRSRHLTGHAFDIIACNAVGKLVYAEPAMRQCARVIKKAAADLDVPIEWGGDWTSFVDTPHFQLPWKFYPENGEPPAKVTPKQLAESGSRIAKASQQQKKDGAKGTGAEVLGHVAEYGAQAAGAAAVLAKKAPAVDVAKVAEQASAFQATVETLEKFAVFVLGKGGLIGTAIALYFLARMAWNAGWIGHWRAEDASDGKTGM